jgi:putative transposase
MEYIKDIGCNAVHKLNFHLVLVTKYRKNILDTEISNCLKQIILDISEKYKITILEQETDMNHIHILFQSKPTVELKKFVNSLKTVSSRLIQKQFKNLNLNNNKFWSNSYFLASVGTVSLETIKNYIENQGK